MKRVPSRVRPDLHRQISEAGFSFSLIDGRPYWNEAVRYEFTLRDIEAGVEQPTNELYALCLELVDRAVVDERLLARLGIPPALRDRARVSWKAREPSLYGRFDFSLSPSGTAKLLEFNADTPTSLYESAVFQWEWLEQGRTSGVLATDADQFNSIHDALVAQWPVVARGSRVHFASLDNEEDEGTTSYVRETARLAGVAVAPQLRMGEIGVKQGRFVDLRDDPITCLFKLYPWEWLIQDEFARSPAMNKLRFVEPAWKAILSTKAILPLLWEMAPGHSNLLPARFEAEPFGADVGSSYVRKPCHSREGANIDVVEAGRLTAQTAGIYNGPCVLQALAPLHDFDGKRPLIGSWIVGDAACGIGIRESAGPITDNLSDFVPHLIMA